MTSAFDALAPEVLRALAEALNSARLLPPYSILALQRIVASPSAAAVGAALGEFAAADVSPRGIALALELLARERSNIAKAAAGIELVWSGPEEAGARTRDTAVVVRQLFEGACRSVLVSGYAVYQGKRIFKELAERMDANGQLRVRMFLNVDRARGDTRTNDEITREFVERFRSSEWPGTRLPQVFFDPRALLPAIGPRSCLHAKCVVIDEEVAFVTSANLTEAAQERNIEAGLLVHSAEIASSLCSQFESLIDSGALRSLAGLG